MQKVLIKTEIDMALYLQLLDAFVQYGNGTLPRVLGSEAGGHFGSAACCVFVNHLGLGGNGCLWLHGPATSWQAPRTAETMGMSIKLKLRAFLLLHSPVLL